MQRLIFLCVFFIVACGKHNLSDYKRVGSSIQQEMIEQMRGIYSVQELEEKKTDLDEAASAACGYDQRS